MWYMNYATQDQGIYLLIWKKSDQVFMREVRHVELLCIQE